MAEKCPCRFRFFWENLKIFSFALLKYCCWGIRATFRRRRHPRAFFPFSSILKLDKSVAGGVVQPRVVVGTPDAGVEVEGLPGQLLGGQLAHAGGEAGRAGGLGALLLPGLKVLGATGVGGVLDPLDHLGHGDEVDIRVVGENLIHPVEEGIKELRVVLEPGCMEEQAQRCTVLVVVAVEVVGQEVVELISAENVGAGVHHGATREVLINSRVLPPVQLIHHHFPHSMGTSGAVLQGTMAPVGHPEVHGVGPQGRVLQGSSNGGVIEEGLLLHHGELVVATNPQVGSSEADNRVVSDVGKLVNNQPAASHFLGPVINSGLTPESLIVVVSDGVGSNLMTVLVHVLDRGVVGVLVGYKEGGLNLAAIGVLPLPVEDLLIEVNVVVVDGVIKGDGDHLGDVLAVGPGGPDLAESSRHLGAVLRAEAVGELADAGVAGGSAVGIGVDVWK